MTFDALAEFSMPLSIAIEVHILDTDRRMLAVLFLCPASDTLGVCIIFDWETGVASMTDTGLPYVSFRTFRNTCFSMPCSLAFRPRRATMLQFLL